MGGWLVSIEDADENSYLATQVNQNGRNNVLSFSSSVYTYFSNETSKKMLFLVHIPADNSHIIFILQNI